MIKIDDLGHGICVSMKGDGDDLINEMATGIIALVKNVKAAADDERAVTTYWDIVSTAAINLLSMGIDVSKRPDEYKPSFINTEDNDDEDDVDKAILDALEHMKMDDDGTEDDLPMF